MEVVDFVAVGTMADCSYYEFSGFMEAGIMLLSLRIVCNMKFFTKYNALSCKALLYIKCT
jgi:hypothetical protein